MTELTDVPPTTITRRPPLRVAARWLAGFVGFPLGGVAAMLLVGPVDKAWAAAAGGLITGSVLGVAQALGLGLGRGRFLGLGRGAPAAGSWIAASAVGMTVGLTVGAAAVDYRTDLSALALQGAICGLVVGGAQAFTLRLRLGRLALAWPGWLALSWALGWTVTTLAGIQVDEQFTVFGSLGAIAVTAATVPLPLALNRNESDASR